MNLAFERFKITDHVKLMNSLGSWLWHFIKVSTQGVGILPRTITGPLISFASLYARTGLVSQDIPSSHKSHAAEFA